MHESIGWRTDAINVVSEVCSQFPIFFCVACIKHGLLPKVFVVLSLLPKC